MALNPMKLIKLKTYKDQFEARHPKPVSFLISQLGSGQIPEGTILELSITRPGEEKATTNLKITNEDVQLIRELMSM